MSSDDKPKQMTTTITYYNISDSDSEDNEPIRIKRKHKSPIMIPATESQINDLISYYYGEAEGSGDKDDEDSYDEEEDLQRSDVDSEGDLIGFIVKSSDDDEDDSSYEPTSSDSEPEFESDMEYEYDKNDLKDKNINNKNKIIIEGDKEDIKNSLLNSLKPYITKKHLVKKSLENKEKNLDEPRSELESQEETLSD